MASPELVLTPPGVREGRRGGGGARLPRQESWLNQSPPCKPPQACSHPEGGLERRVGTDMFGGGYSHPGSFPGMRGS